MIEIKSLDHNGRGIGKLSDKIIFIENALPGEIVEEKVINEKKKYIEAEVKKYIKLSHNRIKSLCPYFDSCGGCDLLHMSYDDQLKFKQDKINNIINKYLNGNIKVNDIIACDNNLYYRNKTTFHINETVGFYKKRTYDIVPIDNCIISNTLINKSIYKLKKLNLKHINKIICRSSIDELMIILDTNFIDINIEPIKEIADSVYIKNNNKYVLRYGKKYITEKIGEYKYIVSPDSFFQINLDICYKLYSKIKEYIGTNKNVLDLYCGTGSISVFISKNNNVLGVEINEFAVNDAKENAKLNNINNIKFICGDSAKILHDIEFSPDIIVLDPPRAGLTKETIENIFKLNPKKIIYVSCDPMTMVRDLNILNERYKIIELTPFDMFPNTKHIESLSLLKKIN